MLKLYVLIRDDITPAQQAVQAGHAVAQFGLEHPKEFKAWQENGNTLIYLSIKDVDYWKTLLVDGEFVHSVFHEPELKVITAFMDWYHTDVVEADTAIAVAPDWVAQYLVFKDLPLALQPQPRSETRKRWWWPW